MTTTTPIPPVETDIVELLLATARRAQTIEVHGALSLAVDEIERTRAAARGMLAALEPFEELADVDSNGYENSPDEEVVRSAGTLGDNYTTITVGDLRRARAAAVAARASGIKTGES